MTFKNYIDWVNTQKWLTSAVRDWLTYNITYGRDLKIIGIDFREDNIYFETESRERKKISMTVKIEEILKYIPDEIIQRT